MAKDFSAKQIRATQILASGGFSTTNVGLAIYSASNASDLEGGIPAALVSNIGSDVFLFVSGTKSGRQKSHGGVTLFGGDIVVSGTLYAERSVIEVNTTTTGSLMISGSLSVSQSATIYEGLTVNNAGESGPENDLTVKGSSNTTLLFGDVSTNRVGIGTGTPGAIVDIAQNAIASDGDPQEFIRLTQTDAGVDMDIGHGPGIFFYVGETSGNDHGGTVAVVREVAGDADSAASMVFHTAIDDTAPAERMRITSTGKVGIGVTDPDSLLEVFGTTTQLKLSNNADDYATLAVGSNGDLAVTTVDAAGTSANFSVAADGAVDIDANQGTLSIDASAGINIGTSADVAIDIDSSTLDIDASGALTIDSATSIAIGANADKPIDIDSTTLDIDASGAITIDGTSTFSVDGVGASNVTTHGVLTLSGSDGLNLKADSGTMDIETRQGAIDLDAAGALSLDSATSISIGTNANKPIDIDATTLDIDATGDITINSAASILILSGGAAGSPNESAAGDMVFFVSGAIASKGTGNKGASVFGGDVIVSGALHGGLSGNAYSMAPLMIGHYRRDLGTDVTTLFVGNVGGGGTALFDGNIFSSGSITLMNTLSASLVKGEYLTGSLTKLLDGRSYLAAGANVTITTGSLGQVAIAATDTNTTYTAGDGLDLTGTTFSTDLKSSGGLLIDSTELAIDDSVVATLSGSTFRGQVTVSQALTASTDIHVGQYIYHAGDTNTSVRFETDEIRLGVGGVDYLKAKAADTAITINPDAVAINTLIHSNNKLAVTVNGTTDQVLILSGGAAGSADEAVGADVAFYVSGSTRSRNTSDRGTSVFGGDVVISGSLFGGSPLVVGDGIDVTGDVTIAEYIKHAGDTDTLIRFQDDSITLTAGQEDLLTITESTQDIVIIGDGGDVDFQVKTNGAANTLFVEGSSDRVGIGTSTPHELLDVRGNVASTGYVSASMGLSGSLTRLVDGTSYLAAGSNVTITSASNGQVIINSTAAGTVDGAGAATRLAYWADADTLMSDPGFHFNGFTLGLTGSASGVTSALDIHRLYSNTAGNSSITSHDGASGILIDYDVTSAVAGGQFQKHNPIWVKYDQSAPSHAGTVQGTGIKVEMTGSTSGVQTMDGISVIVNNPGSLASDASRGISINAPAGWVDGTANGSHLRCFSQADTGDYFDISVGASGITQLTTVDAGAAVAHLNLKPDGKVLILSGGAVTSVADESTYADTCFFVSGTVDSRGTAVAGTSLFGGDLHVSGNLTVDGTSPGGGTPGGSDTQVQYNNGGSFGGVADLTFNDSTGDVTVGTSTGDAKLFFRDAGNYIYSNADGDFDIINTDGTAANSILIDCNAGGVTIDGHTGVTLVAPAGAVDIDADSGTLSLDGSAGINIGTGGAVAVDFNADTLDIDALLAVTIDSAGGTIGIGTDDNDFNISIGTQGGRVIALGSSDAGIDIDAGASGVDIDSGTGGFDVLTTGELALSSSMNSGVAVQLHASAGGIDIAAAGAAGEDINIVNSAGSVKLVALENTQDAIEISAIPGGVMINAGDTTNGIQIGGSTSAVPISIGHTTSETTVNDNLNVTGNLLPSADVTSDLGSASKRWQNIYTGDLHLANDRGNWTIIEEREYLCVKNNITGKIYKMVLEPISGEE